MTVNTFFVHFVRNTEAMSNDQSKRPWRDQPVAMGIINVNPDSWYEQSIAEDVASARKEAEKMVSVGADIIDVGGEGSGKKSEKVSEEIEIKRLRPYIENLSNLDCSLSVDTYKSRVAEEMLNAGADMINDTSGLDDTKMKEVAADHQVPLVINHCIEPMVTEDNESIEYDDVVDEVKDYLRSRAQEAIDAGVDPNNIIVDPGFEFQKKSKYNIEIVKRFEELKELGFPILSGPSRKPKFIDNRSSDLLPVTIALTAITVEKGANIVRVHDVAENLDALKIGYSARSEVHHSSLDKGDY